jgi:uncharacterized protein involved in exopolysaccharide biosynthesis
MNQPLESSFTFAHMDAPTNPNEFNFKSLNVWAFLIRWRKPLLLINLVTALVTAGVTLLLPNKYQSVYIFYPAVTQSVSRLMSSNPGNTKDFGAYGEEEEAERAIQLLQSSEIREYIISKFNLWEAYDIDQNAPKARTKMAKKYNRHVSFRRNEFNAVEISVLHTNPDTAASMANEIAARLDTVKNRIQRERAAEGLRVVEEEYFSLSHRVAEISDSLDVIRGLGINDYTSQSEVLNKEYAIALAKGDQRAVKALEEKLSILSKYGSAYVGLNEALKLQTEQLVMLERKYKEIKADADNNINQKMVVDYAYAADDKASPKRTLIVLAATLFSFILSLFFLVGWEQYSTYQKTKA